MADNFLSRREILAGLGSAAFGLANPTAASARPAGGVPQAAASAAAAGVAGTAPTYHVLGVPFRSGSLYPGSENDAAAYRDAHLLQRLTAAGCAAVDDGDVAVPSYLPHHAVPPIRSWPGPRIVWDCVSERLTPILREPNQIPLLVGCDCSVVVGSVQALQRAKDPGEIHVLYIDGDYDDDAPDAARSKSAAMLAVWLLVNESPFWAGPVLKPSQVTLLGWSNAARSAHAGMGSVSLTELRRAGAGEAARQALATVPAGAALVVHLDIDVFNKQAMPVAYFPHDQGLDLVEGRELLDVVLKDPRIRVIEVSEYASLRDADQRGVNSIVDLLAGGLGRA
ncbi:MAG TPA: arginase family protein [Candidatus Acidoferrales bacterium]